MRAGGWLGRLGRAVIARFPTEKMNVRDLVGAKEVPVHRMSWAYYLGGLAVFFFLIQVATGLMLLFYYKPTVSDAYLSVEYLTDTVPGGALIRNLHAWASSAMIAAVLLHLFTVFAMKAFVKPREITWLSGVVLLLVTLGFGFTGYLLPWNQIAVNATKVGLQSVEELRAYLPAAVAEWPRVLRETFQGEATIGQATLSRFFALHVVVLPVIVALLLGMHLLSVQLHGMSQGVDKPTGRAERFFPLFLMKDFTVWGVAFIVLFVLALALPFDAFTAYPLLEPFNALGATPDGIQPEWYFLFVYYPLQLVPFWVVFVGMNLVVLALVFAPWLFRRTSRTVLRVLAVVALLYIIGISFFGHQVYVLFKGHSL